jgi:hypothetical protein
MLFFFSLACAVYDTYSNFPLSWEWVSGYDEPFHMMVTQLNALRQTARAVMEAGFEVLTVPSELWPVSQPDSLQPAGSMI